MTKGIKGIEGGFIRGKVSFKIVKWGIFREGVVCCERIIEGANGTIQNFNPSSF